MRGTHTHDAHLKRVGRYFIKRKGSKCIIVVSHQMQSTNRKQAVRDHSTVYFYSRTHHIITSQVFNLLQIQRQTQLSDFIHSVIINIYCCSNAVAFFVQWMTYFHQIITLFLPSKPFILFYFLQWSNNWPTIFPSQQKFHQKNLLLPFQHILLFHLQK